MRFGMTGIVLLSAMVFVAAAAAQTTPTPSAITRTVIAATKLPTVTDVPLYFRAWVLPFRRARRASSRRLTASSIRYRDRPRSQSVERQRC